MIPLNDILQDPAPFENKSIEVRGFLYLGQEGEFFLADRPNIRSCCLGKDEIIKLMLIGEFPKPLPTQAVTIKGELRLIKKPYLENATIETSSISYSIAAFLIVPILAVLLFQAIKHRA